MNIQSIMQSSPVIPVITIDRPEQALPLAEALLEGGLKVLEITLRTPAALEAISTVRQAFGEAIVGAGTVINEQTYSDAEQAGSQFIVSPGFTPALLAKAAGSQVPLLPGVNTPSEVMTLLAAGITCMKFFPAEAAGGIPMLKSIGAPLPQALFCPTGGISLATAPDYLALANVACVGGSWMLNQEWINKGQWQLVRDAAKQAALLSQ